MRIYPLTRAGISTSVTKREDAMPPLEDFGPTIGDALRARRKELGLLQKQVAAMLGCTVTFVSMIECGQRRPSLAFLNRISRALGSSLTITASYNRDSTRA